jgi:hypothetical protein
MIRGKNTPPPSCHVLAPENQALLPIVQLGHFFWFFGIVRSQKDSLIICYIAHHPYRKYELCVGKNERESKGSCD